MFRTLLTICLSLLVGALSLQSQSAAAESVPATFVKDISCKSNWENSFWDVGTAACWVCPSATPKRTVFPVTGNKACEKPAHEKFAKAKGPVNPSGLLKTDCPSGYFLDVGKGKCYSCSGMKRTAFPVTHAKACSAAVKVAWDSATRKGAPSCPSGSFRHLTSNNCYACPEGSYRNANTGSDPTKFNACTKCGGQGEKPCPITTARKSCDDGLVEHIGQGICVASPSNTRAKFNQNKSLYEQRQNTLLANMTKSARRFNAVEGDTPVGGASDEPRETRILFGTMTNEERRQLMKDLLAEQDGGVITLVGGANLSAVVGYGHATGWAMMGSEGSYTCRELTTNAFTAGVSGGGSVGWETGSFQEDFDDLAGETNGIQGGTTLVVIGFSGGTHWSASTGEFAGITVGNGGSSYGLDVGLEYVHGWSKVADESTPCSEITWD